MKCEIVKFMEIGIGELEPHPLAEAFPRDGADQSAVNMSVGDEGVLAPLHVLAEPDKQTGKWQVVDGCTRLLAAMVTGPDGDGINHREHKEHKGERMLPCLLVRVDDVASYVLHINGARRRVSTGTRVLAYVTCHKAQVLAAAELAGGRVKNMRGSVNGLEAKLPKRSRERFGSDGDAETWSCDEIAARLGVSHADVESAVELLRCKELRNLPAMEFRGSETLPERGLDEANAEDVARGKVVDECYLRVLGGQTPIRRWKAAFAGKASPNAGKGAPDYAELGRRSLIGLRTVLNHWGEVDTRQIKGIIDIWRKMRDQAIERMG